MIAAKRAHLVVSATSHPGQSGKNNEDRYGVSAFELENEQRTPSALAVIADGIGGHRAGEVAAELAVNTISQVVAEGDPSHPVNTLQNAVIQASRAIYKMAQKDPVLHGMGSTCACAWIIGERFFAASVGDSRIYLIRGERILQLTTDHTWIQEAIDQGVLRPEQARAHPNAHVIRRYLGSRQEVVPDLRVRSFVDDDYFSESNQGAYLYPGDILLLSSDGLTDLVSDAEILSAVRNHDLKSSLDALIGLANQRGGHDNITLVALGVPTSTERARTVTGSTNRRFVPVPCLVVSLMILAGIFLVGSIYWVLGRREVSGNEGVATQPGIQVTLFPPGAGLSPGETMSVSPTAQISGTLAPGVETLVPGKLLQPAPSEPPSVATLTPWPTNTPGSAP